MFIFFLGTVHAHLNNHGYFFSWEDSRTANLEHSWPEAREFCRVRCMELVSLETREENDFVKEHIRKGNLVTT